ncbi:MAG: Gfo/Idh/MocA family oxidoreductase [Flavobacteriaceae bacterium]|jgi:predicted dehydrogenase|nr:Gfo/Idh/MocA family oxidoreductase [Flavobacteriaceae bacterium]MBT5595545.1 Gfo/Idh/MocA family oxidoreductase [Flavobacteriaceae bacterium]MBT5857259.1 Gfo/Idh/MocA family oxidoreductase [Flavobacteriaceae bacterium]MBT6688742.1 Gfo/Idh/MocA family oxidoreductase [Flavobacteriaceae bacterium]MBT7319922.1 Gfo/Idh/MocA family oxidoreductase [Flavobacteriaceae bacterium]
MKNFNRRKFIKTTTMSAAVLTAASTLASCTDNNIESISKGLYMGGFSAPKLDTVRVAFIGVGARGSGHLRSLASLEGVEVVAISDLYEDYCIRSSKVASEIGKGERHNNIAQYWGAENKWELMLEEIKPDAVFISTNWNNHAPMAIKSMESGAHAFVEVPIAVSLKDMWKIVDTSERTQKHCMMMENVNYGRDELMYLNMCRKGVIGKLLHAEAAYIHELRFQMSQEERGTGSWRTHHYANGNGNLYPTHGLGPVAQYMNIGRTDDSFKSIVSYSSPARGRELYAKKNYSLDHKWNKLNYLNGDINTSIIKTNIGRTVMVQWDETSPRPYTRHNLIQGTKGTLAGFPTRVAIEGGFEGASKDHHSWIQGDKLEMLYEKYDHPLYKRLNQETKNSGHGGMDGIMRYRIIECLRNGLPLDQNVYEGCFWSAVTPLSGKSISEEGAPQKFPDFTRGNWKTTKQLDIIL